MFKILNGYENIESNVFLEIKESKITRGHNFTLVNKQSRFDVRKFSFSQRTINVWNKLSAECVHASQGSTLAMCPLARMHFLRRRASSGHNNSFYAGPRGQWLSDRWQTRVPVFSVDVSRVTVRWFDLQVFSSTEKAQSYSTCAY